MTCQHIPTVAVDHYDFGTVVAVRRDLGVFIDIGLPNKDVVVSLDELPTLKHLWPQPGDRLLIALRVDDHDRLWGPSRTKRFLQRSPTAPKRRWSIGTLRRPSTG